jgi:DNA mismatch repair ATPase MutS
MTRATDQDEHVTPGRPAGPTAAADRRSGPVSVLFAAPTELPAEAPVPDFFTDLNLDQIVDSVLIGRGGYHLAPLFAMPLHSRAEVEYRHGVFRDLQRREIADPVRDFARGMERMRECLQHAKKRYEPLQQRAWFLYAVRCYCDTVTSFDAALSTVEVKSAGLESIRDHLHRYVESDVLIGLRDETRAVQEGLDQVRYMMQIKGSHVAVLRYADQPDYSEEIAATFGRFVRGEARNYLVRYRDDDDVNHVEAQVLDLVAQLYPDEFQALQRFCDHRQDYLEATIGRFDREIQFYLAYLDHMKTFTSTGLSFCFPEVTETDKAISATDTFDLALADTLVPAKEPVVCNDFHLDGGERILVVSGPNQGGKTTLARTFGQLHHLASLGLPVPGRSARLLLPDRLFTHFERRENLADLRGKLADDLVRIRDILTHATASSVVVLNEAFTSTTLEDSLFLGKRVLERLTGLDLLGVYVTFVDELASLNDAIVSMVSTVDADNPAVRTYKVVRRPADGRSYALAIADKYGLTYEQLKGRIGS